MDTLQEFYDKIDSSNFNYKADLNINNTLQELYVKLHSESKVDEANNCELERQIFAINKSFNYTANEEKGTVNGLSYTFAGTQTFEDGTTQPVYWPDVTKLTKKDYEYCEKRYNECKNLNAKIEYGLMVYFGQQTDYSKRNDFKKQLCNELFTLAKEYFQKTISGGERNHYVLDFTRYLEMAFIVADRAKLSDEIKEIVEYVFNTHQNWDVSADGTLRVLLDLSCLMSDHFKTFKDCIDFNKVIEKNIEGAQELEKTYLWGAIYVVEKNIIIEQQMKLSQESSLRYKAEIYEKMMTAEENKNNYLVSVKFAETALRLYQSLKDQTKTNELNAKYAELRGKIQLSAHKQEMPLEYTQSISESIKKTITESDEREILDLFIFTPWYSTNEEIQKYADAISKQSFLSAFAATSILDKFGNTIDTFNTEEEIKEHNFWQAFNFSFQLGTQTMHQFFIEAYKAGKLNYQSTIEYLETTWFNEPI
ncbi:MAG: DUF4209 domain-containing protein, partial [Petrimonas sp.]